MNENEVRKIVREEISDSMKGGDDGPFAKFVYSTNANLANHERSRGEHERRIAALEGQLAPAQPARSTREPSVEALTINGIAADTIRHVCKIAHEYGWNDREPLDKFLLNRLEAKRITAPPPAREKDGEALTPEQTQQLVAWFEERARVAGTEPSTIPWGAVRADLLARVGMPASCEPSAPRSPSPLSASTQSNKAETETVAQSVEQPIDKPVRTESRSSDAGSSPAGPVSAPSIAQQAEPSVAGVPTVDDVMDAYNAGTTRFDEDLTLAHSAMTALEFTAARQRAGFAAVRALCLASRAPVSVDQVASAIAPAFCDDPFEDLRPEMQEDLRKAARLAMGCLASRGARGTEDDRSRKSNELVQRAKPLIEALWAGSPTKPADSRMWLEAWTEHMKGHLSTCGYVQFDGMRVAMTGECLCPGDATPKATDFDDMEGRGPCGGSRCFLSHARDGEWIHSSKSYRTCSVRRAAPSRGERREADAVRVPRVETGVVQFDDDWPGVFIRGDNAFGWARTLAYSLLHAQAAKDGLKFPELEPLIDLLASSDARNGIEPRMLTLQPSAPASVERDEALEDLFSVAETIESWHIAKEDGLAGEDEEDLHFALLTTILSKLRAMKSPPAPSSASVTPKNDGGAG